MITLTLAAACLFTPPDGWKLSDPKTPSKRAIIGFIDQSRSGFCPSIHLTCEEISVPIEEYLSIVQKNSLNKKQKWRRLGKISTQSGLAHLIEIETKTQMGPVRILQAILFKEGQAHILTAGATKKDFIKNVQFIRESMASMLVTEDLFALSKDPKKLQGYWQKREEDIRSFQKAVLEEKNLGAVWQIQMMMKK